MSNFKRRISRLHSGNWKDDIFLATQTQYRGSKRLVSVNICSVEGNSAGVFVSKVPPEICVTEGKMNACYFREDKTAVLGAIKAQLPFSEGKYQLLSSGAEIPFPTLQCSII